MCEWLKRKVTKVEVVVFLYKNPTATLVTLAHLTL
jgi:hypothetical protein